MADPTRPLTLSDLWLPGDVLGGVMLEDYRGMATIDPWAGGGFGGSGSYIGLYRMPGGGGQKKHLLADAGFGTVWTTAVRLDCRRPEVRDRAVRVLGPDLLPIHAAELRGEITPGEAAGLVWCSMLRREAGLGVVRGPPLTRTEAARCWCPPGSPDDGLRAAVYDDQMIEYTLQQGISVRDDDGALLLPLPDGVVGRLDTRR